MRVQKNKSIHHVEIGQGQDIAILIHGFPMTHRLWHKVTPHLEAHMRLILVDLKGFGGSSVKGAFELSFEELADDIANLMDDLGIERAHIIGASFGAMVTMMFGFLHKSRVQSLVILHTEADPDDEEAKAGRYAQIKTVRNQGAKAFAHIFAKRVLGPKAVPETLDFLSNMMAENNAQAMIAGLRLLRDRPDFRLLLPDIPAPALVVAGTDDPHSPPEIMEKTAALFPDSQFHIMDAVRHLSTIECPQSVAKMVRDWVLSHKHPVPI